MIVITRREGEEIIIGDVSAPLVVIRVVGIRGDRTRIAVDCPRELAVHRREIADAMAAEVQKRERALVAIHLPSAEPAEELEALESIQSAVASFMEEFGFEIDPLSQPQVVVASWHWRSVFRVREDRVRSDLGEVYGEMREALRRHAIDRTGAESFGKRAEAAKELIEALSSYDDAVVRLGEVVLIKSVSNGRKRLLVRTLSPELTRLLEKRPDLESRPADLLQTIECGADSSSDLDLPDH